MRTSGLFDLQVNGFAGIDFNSEAIDADALDHALEAMLATGVTACLPTLITASDDVLEARFCALDRAVAQSRLGPLMVPGLSPRRAFPQFGRRLCGMPSARSHEAP